MPNTSGGKEMILKALVKEMNCGCSQHGLMWQSNCVECREADTTRFEFFYDFGKAIRTYLLQELVDHPDFGEFRIYYDGTKLVIHPININGKTLDIPLFQDPR